METPEAGKSLLALELARSAFARRREVLPPRETEGVDGRAGLVRDPHLPRLTGPRFDAQILDSLSRRYYGLPTGLIQVGKLDAIMVQGLGAVPYVEKVARQYAAASSALLRCR